MVQPPQKPLSETASTPSAAQETIKILLQCIYAKPVRSLVITRHMQKTCCLPASGHN